MSIGIKPYDAGGGAIQIGGTDAIEIDSSLNVTIPQDLTVSQDLVVTGTITSQGQVIGAGPAFSAYRGTARNTAASGWQAVIPDTEEFDTASCYDTTTGRFTPNVAGYYQINGEVYASASTNEILVAIYKNGGAYKYGSRTAPNGPAASVSSVIYFNGTTDYVELYVYYNGSPAVALSIGSTYNYMNGVFVRPA